jgi:hypothetical protein
MSEGCNVCAHCYNSKGEEVESRLFQDLLHFTSNDRSLAKKYYKIAMDQRFLDKVSDRAKFDENGEITFNSLRKLARINIKTDRILETLNKDIGAGVYTYDEAIVKLQSFNRNSQFKKEFMATVEHSDRGKYKLSIVKRNARNEAALNKLISNATLQNRIKYYLNRAGVSVEFIERDEKVNGRYSTKNAQRTAEGMYQLIQVAHGVDVTETLAEEAGHFAIGAMDKSPLTKRLFDLLTPEVQRQIIGEEYDSKFLGESTQREVAGTLVGRAIAGHIDQRAPWQKLVNRIIDTAKRLFYHMKGDSIKKDALAANKIAEQIAAGFMSPNFTGDVETALKTKETLFSANNSFNVKTFKQVANRLKTAAAEMSAINEEWGKKLLAAYATVEAGRNVDIPGFAGDNMALEGITQAVVSLSEFMVQEIPALLDSVDFDNALDFYNNMPRNAKALKIVREFTTVAEAVLSVISDAISKEGEQITGDVSNVILQETVGTQTYNVVYNLKEIAKSLNGLINEADSGLIHILSNKEKAFFCRFLEDSYGSKYINQVQAVLWDGQGKRFLNKQKANSKSIHDNLTYLENDITFFERFIASAADSSDIVTQIGDKVSTMANKRADDNTNLVQEKLKVMQTRLHSIGLKNTDIFCEKSLVDGKLTGNIVTEYCYGDYENDWLAFKKECLEEFRKNNPDIDDMSEFEVAVLWDNYFNNKRLEWHQGTLTEPAHSKWSRADQCWIPASQYANPQWTELQKNKDQKEWLDDYIELKKEIDSVLPEGSTKWYRMPQFKGTFANKVRNRNLTSGLFKSTGRTIREELRDTFCRDSEDTDFGSDQTFNTEEEDMFGNAYTFDREKIDRIPLYGINKLKDMGALCTDLFQSTLAYAGMAYTYAAKSAVVDTFEVGSTVLLNRKVHSTKTEEEDLRKKDGEASWAYQRYIKFLEKQVYQIGQRPINLGRKIVINKVAALLSRIAGKLFLGGNVAGGAVNTGTGTIEVFKEAASGEYYNLGDWKEANKMYFASLPSNLLNFGKQEKEDKVSLAIKHFNMFGENKLNQREWHTRRNRIIEFFGRSLYLPYKSGDHYMQSMSYLALANHTKVYDENGEERRLWDAYSVVDITDEDGNTGTRDKKGKLKKYGKKLELNGTYITKKSDVSKYKMLKTLIAKFDASLSSSSPLGGGIILSQEEQDYITNKGYNLADMEDTRDSLKRDLNDITWNVSGENEFMNKAREINDRLHGIYNAQDGVALSQNIFGNMLLAMKGYALGMAERRFGNHKYNVRLGHDVEGSLWTTGKVIMSTFTDEGGFLKTARMILLPIIMPRSTKALMYKMGFSPNQYYNMRRNFMDNAFIALLMILKMMTGKGDDDDDDEYAKMWGVPKSDNYDSTTGLCYYFASRLLREQEGFNTIRGFAAEVPTLAQLTPVGFAALKDLTNLAYLGVGSLVADEDNSDFFYQSSSEDHEKYDSKFEKKFWRRFPYLRFSYVLNHPYEAAAAYDYGKNTEGN